MTTNDNRGDDTPLSLLSSNSMRAVLDPLLPEFERDSGRGISVSYDVISAIVRRALDGESVDMVIVHADAMAELVNSGRILAGGHANLAQSGIGLSVRSGAPRPDIRSVEAFRQALLDAKSIAYTTQGASGLYFTRLIERLGVTPQVQGKSVTRASGIIGELVARGEAEMAIQYAPQLQEVPGIDFVGLLPVPLQDTCVMTAGVLANTAQPGAARALLGFLTSPSAANRLEAMGYDLCPSDTKR